MFLTKKDYFSIHFQKNTQEFPKSPGGIVKNPIYSITFSNIINIDACFNKFFGVNLNPSVFNHKRIRRFENKIENPCVKMYF